MIRGIGFHDSCLISTILLTHLSLLAQVKLPQNLHMNTSQLSYLMEHLQKGEVSSPFLHYWQKLQITKASCEYLSTHVTYEVLLLYNNCINVHDCYQTIVP